ncbi:MAG: M4 family metallopeptidase [Flavobacteriales bacterium]|nr:M4 family metallopeptidase [Flavobacteriales bacterium]
MKTSIPTGCIASLCILAMSSGLLHAQEITGQAAATLVPDATVVRVDPSRSSRPLFVSFDDASARHANKSGMELILSTVQAKPSDAYQLVKTEPDAMGYQHEKYQQLYKGIPVQGGEFRAHVLNGTVRSINGLYYDLGNINVTPSVPEASALQSALGFAGATKYIWQDQTEIENLRKVFEDPTLDFSPKAELWIVAPNFDASSGDFRLAYKYNIWAMEPDGRWELYVDAQTGEIIARNDLIHTADATGTAKTRYDGTQTIITDSYNGSYRLREAGRGNGIQTYNAQHGTSTGGAVDFTDSDNNWTSTANADDAGTSAHFAAEMMYDYLKKRHNRNSIDGNGFKLLGYVHWDNGWVNASWNGQYMRYGDGNGDPLTTIDIGCHEVAHGLTSESANLVYQNESGALNESFSDIFGTAVEWYATPSRGDYLIAEDIGAFRSMSNPNTYSNPDTYKGTYWETSSNDNGGVHTNSGVQNHWYYLLSEGKSGTNDNGNAYQVTGIGREKAENIAFRNLTVYLSSNSNYADSRYYSLQAAKDLYGDCSNEYAQTANAWYAVGVGDPVQCNVAPEPDFVADVTASCDGKVQFTDKSTFAPTSWAWDFGDGASSTQQNPSHTYTASGTFTVKLTATNAYGQNTDTKTSYVTISLLSPPTTQGDQVCGSGTVNLSASGSGNKYNWYDAANGGNLLYTGSPYSPSVSSTTSYWVEAVDEKAKVKGGPADNTIGTGGYFTANDLRGLFFDVTSSVYLRTVKVYANTAGDRLIEVLQGSDTGPVYASKTVTIPAGESRVTLDFYLQPGTNYFIKCTGDPTTTPSDVDLYRNDAGSTFPLNVGGVVSITGTNAGSDGYYYYFYDWEIQEKECVSERVEVVATVDPNGVNPTISADNSTVCAGDAVNMDAGSGYTAYQWSTGATTQTVTVNPTANTTYSVTVTASGGCTGNTSTSISVNPLPTPTITQDVNGTLFISGITGTHTYQWFRDGALISGATNDTYVPNVNGVYTVKVTDANGCTGESSPLTVLNVGIAQVGQDVALRLFPNPAGDQVNLSIEGKGTLQMEVINLIGETVIVKRNLPSGTHRISLAGLPDGVYMVRLIATDTQAQKVIRLVKGL